MCFKVLITTLKSQTALELSEKPRRCIPTPARHAGLEKRAAFVVRENIQPKGSIAHTPTNTDRPSNYELATRETSNYYKTLVRAFSSNIK